MSLHFVAVPVLGGEREAEELNAFLASHRIVAVERHLVQEGGSNLWAICVTYSDAEEASARVPSKKGRVDYRELLSAADFARYARLRGLRKELAEREGVPPYALFTNEQLAAMVKRPVTNARELGEIEGVGEARLSKYGAAFLAALQEPAPPDGRADAAQ